MASPMVWRRIWPGVPGAGGLGCCPRLVPLRAGVVRRGLRRGEDERAVGRDGDGVLDVGGAAAVGAADGPAVAVNAVAVAAAGQEPRLDRDDEPGDECRSEEHTSELQ